jgi:hypothetical protein
MDRKRHEENIKEVTSGRKREKERSFNLADENHVDGVLNLNIQRWAASRKQNPQRVALSFKRMDTSFFMRQ